MPEVKRWKTGAYNFNRRKVDHWKTLRGNRHVNRHLQRAWNKYGEVS
jgi:hypothetical protein